uniref:Uncharacterized protein n=1 Tax=Glossina morsitans morsitans TaxID=37546 RepID=A0A1B0GF72_GLOMM
VGFYLSFDGIVEASGDIKSLLGSSDGGLPVSPSLTFHAKHMRTTYRMPDIEEYELECLIMENVEDLCEQQETLRTKISSLETQNLELKNVLKSEAEQIKRAIKNLKKIVQDRRIFIYRTVISICEEEKCYNDV